MRRIKSLLKEWLSVPKDAKVSDKFLSRIMLSSVLGILICGISLFGLTWAWFSGSVSSTSNTIQSANFSVGIEVKQGETRVSSEGEVYNLTDGEYTVTLTPSGTATTGYCIVEFNGTTYYTEQFSPNGGITFIVNGSEDSTLTVTSQWGTYSVPATEEKPRIGSTPDEENHIVNSIGTPLAISLDPSTEASDPPAEGAEQSAEAENTEPAESTDPSTEGEDPSAETENTEPAESADPSTEGSDTPAEGEDQSAETENTEPAESTDPSTEGEDPSAETEKTDPAESADPSTEGSDTSTEGEDPSAETENTDPAESTDPSTEGSDTPAETENTEPSAESETSETLDNE